MYQVMKRVYYWEGMKRDIGKFISKCINGQFVKAEQKKPSGLLQPLEVPTWKQEQVSMDFIDGLPRTKQGNGSGRFRIWDDEGVIRSGRSSWRSFQQRF